MVQPLGKQYAAAHQIKQRIPTRSSNPASAYVPRTQCGLSTERSITLSYTGKETDTCCDTDGLEEITPSEISQAQTDRQLAHGAASVRCLEQGHGHGKLDGGCHGQRGRRKESGCSVGTQCHSGR